MSYWSEASVSSQISGIVSREKLEEALAWADHAATQADQAEECASHLKGIMRDMMSMLNARFEVMSFEDILARIPALAPILASAFGDDDDDVDLENFWCILFF